MGLPDGETHVWAVDLDRDPATVERCAGLLDATEQTRAARLRFARDRDRVIVTRAACRTLLARYLGIEAHAVRFERGLSGKPALAGGADLQFNDSRSGDLALVAVRRGEPLGVDLERFRDVPERAEIVERFGAAPERAAWRALPDHERPMAFLRWWTAKEAFLKATGVGLLVPLDTFAVPLGAGDRVEVLDARAGAEAGRWFWLTGLQPAPGYIGALVTPSTPGTVRLRRCPLF